MTLPRTAPRCDAEQHLRELGAAGADQAIDPEDLAAPQRKGNVFEFAGAAQVLDAQQLLARVGLPALGNSCSTGRPTIRRISSSLVTSLTSPALTDTPSRNTA